MHHLIWPLARGLDDIKELRHVHYDRQGHEPEFARGETIRPHRRRGGASEDRLQLDGVDVMASERPSIDVVAVLVLKTHPRALRVLVEIEDLPPPLHQL